MNDQLAIVLGTRPEIIKLAPIIRACDRTSVEYTLVHTGQHYSEKLDAVFFEQLGVPEPDFHLGIGSASHGVQTGRMLIALEKVLSTTEPETVIVQGDTNSVLAGSLATSKLDASLAHVEAGLRSFDRSMPEETNRVIADHVSDVLFAPTTQSANQLLAEGISAERIVLSGNTIVDAVEHHRSIAEGTSTVLTDLGVAAGRFLLLTAHRQENVDNEDRFREILRGVAAVSRAHDLPVIYPIHPRAKDRIDAFNIPVPEEIWLVEPLDYLDFLRLQESAALIMTDSGGVQEEACVLGVPCVTIRDSTERPETVRVGANQLSACTAEAISTAATEMIGKTGAWDNPFGDGDAAEIILADLVARKEHLEVVQ